jgi:hypothetical protein
LAWHKILNIEEKVVINQDLDDQLDKIETTSSGIFNFKYIYINHALTNCYDKGLNSTQLSSASLQNFANKFIDVVGTSLQDTVLETMKNSIAELSHLHFPKVKPDVVENNIETSQIIIPPIRLQQLRLFLKDPTAQFTCQEQAVVFELMMRRTQSLLAILSTGTGKTFTILLQAALQKNLITIVVLPLSTLHDDLKRRAAILNVSYSKWHPNNKFNPNVCVISVSIEHLGFQDFIRYIFL